MKQSKENLLIPEVSNVCICVIIRMLLILLFCICLKDVFAGQDRTDVDSLGPGVTGRDHQPETRTKTPKDSWTQDQVHTFRNWFSLMVSTDGLFMVRHLQNMLRAGSIFGESPYGLSGLSPRRDKLHNA